MTKCISFKGFHLCVLNFLRGVIIVGVKKCLLCTLFLGFFLQKLHVNEWVEENIALTPRWAATFIAEVRLNFSEVLILLPLKQFPFVCLNHQAKRLLQKTQKGKEGGMEVNGVNI